MHWHHDGGEFFFEAEGEKKGFFIELTTECFEKLSSDAQKKFSMMGDGYRFEYAMEQAGPREEVVYLSTRRIVQEGNPSRIELEELKQWVTKKKVVFYTGAGISAAAGIPTMHQLSLLFPFTHQWIEKSVQSPEAVLRKVDYFYRACHKSSPTKAHWALKQMIAGSPQRLLTENLDQLHQKTGLNPLCVQTDQIAKEISIEELKSIDAIVCIGLSHDAKGLLGWYKEHNKEGKIISIDLKQPSYLNTNDYWLEGDIQKVIPSLVH